MRKSLLAIVVAMSMLVSACNEQNSNAATTQLQQAEQKISQLNEQLAKSQQELTALQQSIAGKNR
ncbi:Uncharacterised protein [Actinobacillus ureae]|nr:hypothetical protein [Actinobacillus ureae]SUU49888.1 Uncharacterised protein [Actinobacillus ureae]